jgi:hypothetical protein
MEAAGSEEEVILGVALEVVILRAAISAAVAGEVVAVLGTVFTGEDMAVRIMTVTMVRHITEILTMTTIRTRMDTPHRITAVRLVLAAMLGAGAVGMGLQDMVGMVTAEGTMLDSQSTLTSATPARS